MTLTQAIKKYGENQILEIVELIDEGFGSNSITHEGPNRPDGKAFTVNQIDAIANAWT